MSIDLNFGCYILHSMVLIWTDQFRCHINLQSLIGHFELCLPISENQFKIIDNKKKIKKIMSNLYLYGFWWWPGDLQVQCWLMNKFAFHMCGAIED